LRLALFSALSPQPSTLTQKRELRPQAQLVERTAAGSGLDVRLDVVDRLLHSRDLLGFLVRDLALEFFFQRHDQFDRLERVRAEIVHERGIRRHFVFLYAKLFDDDFLDALFDGAHVLDLTKE
jgi:hypothetical protein